MDYAPKYINLELVSSLGEGCRSRKYRSDEERLLSPCVSDNPTYKKFPLTYSHTFGTDCVKRSGGTDKSGFSVRKLEDKNS